MTGEKAEWRYDSPPPRTVVEVQDEGNIIIRVVAVYGDKAKGVLPHWESEDGHHVWYHGWFHKWRKVSR